MDADDELKEITDRELENSVEAFNYITKVQKRINKLQNKIEAIDRQTSILKKEKTHLNYRLNRMESLQKLAILGTLRVNESI
jgi:predicted RNase H-like nuclease (RuvC/YqgF family)